jgi:hypothetical protein
VAGILFGAGSNLWSGGYTMGSYCGRVRQFLAASYVVFQRLPGNTTMVAQAPAPTAPIAIQASPALQGLPQPPGFARAGTMPAWSASDGYAPSGNPAPRYDIVPVPSTPQAGTTANNPRSSPPHSQTAPSNPVAQVPPAVSGVASDLPVSRTDQVKTVLAVIGVIAVLFHGLRLIASAVG